MNVIYTEKAPAAIGPYSQAMTTGNLLFTSGQIPINPATGEIAGTTIQEQTEQVMKNLGEVLLAAGSSYDKVVKTTCYGLIITYTETMSRDSQKFKILQ